MNIVFVFCSLIAIGVIAADKTKHALSNECASCHLKPGTYRCMVNDQSFYVDCMVDGTMYINAEQQALYHYYKQTEHEMKFELVLAVDYKSIEDVDEAQLKSFALRSDDADDTDAALNDESLESEELTEPEKKTVNLTAQYIVYAVIIVMAIVFTLGVSALIYYWCCRDKCGGNKSNEDNAERNLVDETTPFIDIRGNATLQRKALRPRAGRSVYLQSATLSQDTENDQEDELHRDRHNIYDDINGADDNEDGDDLIAHYGATNSNESNSGYIIAQYDADTPP